MQIAISAIRNMNSQLGVLNSPSHTLKDTNYKYMNRQEQQMYLKMLFIDFKQAYDSVIRVRLVATPGITNKVIKVKRDSNKVIDPLFAVRFNLLLENIFRSKQNARTDLQQKSEVLASLMTWF